MYPKDRARQDKGGRARIRRDGAGRRSPGAVSAGAVIAGVFAAGLAGTLALLPAGPAAAQSRDLFERLAGSWSGSGAANLSDGSQERIRCRADYRPYGPERMGLDLRCASDSFNVQASGDVRLAGNRLVGTWSEETMGTSGTVSGSAGADTIDAVIQGGGISARLRLSLQGTSQAVMLTTPTAAASVRLSRR